MAISLFGPGRLTCRPLGRPGRSNYFETEGQAMPLKVGEIIRMLEADGWYLVVTAGSHRQYKHRTKPGRVTVAGKPSADLPPGTERSTP